MGNWSRCSRSCDAGVRSRSVLCQRRLSASEEKTLDDSACPQPRPPVLEACQGPVCPPEWAALEWSEVSPLPPLFPLLHWCMHHCPSVLPAAWNLKCTPLQMQCTPSCGPGLRHRVVLCKSADHRATLPPAHCPPAAKPPTTLRCNLRRCPPARWMASEWGEVRQEVPPPGESREVHASGKGGAGTNSAGGSFCSAPGHAA